MALIESGPDGPRGPSGGARRWSVLVGAAVVVAGAGASVLWSASHSGEPTADPGVIAQAPAPDQGGASRAPEPDPLDTAQLWLEMSRTASYADPGPASWTERVAPLLTGPAAAENSRIAESGASGAGWELIVEGRCSTSVGDVGAVIPAEAPRTEQQVYVQVTGTVVTGCAGPDGPPIPVERTSATLELVLDDGRWLVNDRLY